MKKKSHIPVMYMLVAIYMTFSLFDLFEKSDISLVNKLSYVFLIIVPLGLIILAVWQRNSRKEVSAFAANARYVPIGIASALFGVGLFASNYGGPLVAVLAAAIGLVLSFLGFNRIRNLTAPKTLVSIDLPPGETAKIEKRLSYEPFMKFGLVPDQKQLETVNLPAGAGAVHLTISRDPLLFEKMSDKKLAAEQLGESPKELPAHLKDPDRRWCAVGINPITVAVNPAAWKKRLEVEAEPIRKLETLLSPNLVGSFVIPDPEKSDAGFLFLAGLVQHRGEAEGLAFLTELKKHAARMAGDPMDAREIFADPEILAAVGFLNDFLSTGYWRKALLLGVPEGASWEMARAAIPLSSPSPEQSAAFLDFLVGKAGNEVFASKALLMPTHPKALVPMGSPPVEGAAINPDFDLKKALAEKSDLLRKWRGYGQG